MCDLTFEEPARHSRTLSRAAYVPLTPPHGSLTLNQPARSVSSTTRNRTKWSDWTRCPSQATDATALVLSGDNAPLAQGRYYGDLLRCSFGGGATVCSYDMATGKPVLTPSSACPARAVVAPTKAERLQPYKDVPTGGEGGA